MIPDPDQALREAETLNFIMETKPNFYVPALIFHTEMPRVCKFSNRADCIALLELRRLLVLLVVMIHLATRCFPAVCSECQTINLGSVSLLRHSLLIFVAFISVLDVSLVLLGDINLISFQYRQLSKMVDRNQSNI